MGRACVPEVSTPRTSLCPPQLPQRLGNEYPARSSPTAEGRVCVRGRRGGRTAGRWSWALKVEWEFTGLKKGRKAQAEGTARGGQDAFQ